MEKLTNDLHNNMENILKNDKLNNFLDPECNNITKYFLMDDDDDDNTYNISCAKSLCITLLMLNEINKVDQFTKSVQSRFLHQNHKFA